MFDKYTVWTQHPCYYIFAFKGFHRSWLAGPYKTLQEAVKSFQDVQTWALLKSGDKQAKNYEYRICQHDHGETRSILGEWQS